MDNSPSITILMATYNGENYIREQLESLISQTYKNWYLQIRDDGSTDSTVQIIEEYSGRFTNIALQINTSQKKGACHNFSALFNWASANRHINYIMFCDQDDIWKPEKIERSVDTILKLENGNNLSPALVYSNFEIIDSEGQFIPRDFKLKHTISLRNIISYNYVLGCTIILNRAMMDKIDNIAEIAVNHDYWIALVASNYNSRFINEKILRYRQHNNNTSQNYQGNNSLKNRLKRLVFSPGKEISYLKEKLAMLTQFYTNYRDVLSADNSKLLEKYLDAFKINRFQVCYIMVKYHIFRRGFFQTFASFFQIMFFYNRIIK